MSDIVNQYFKKFYPEKLGEDMFTFMPRLGGMWEYADRQVKTIFPEMICRDGFKMSVQGHLGAYSRPRDDFADHYSAVEVGYPSEEEELLLPYMDGDGAPTGAVYGWVPIDVVVAVIEKHGGLE